MIELKALQGQVRLLVDDLRDQVAAIAELHSSLTAEYRSAIKAQRTAATFETWLEDVLDQAAVAWVLSCVFVRFCEDNDLVRRCWIGGPAHAAPAERALQERQGYLISHPLHNDRHWLRESFTYLASLRATGKIFDAHNPVWRFDITGQAAERLSDFFRQGEGSQSLESPQLNTRFLGDLYQHLSVHARETYALLQTPEFVEKFILDRTFEPAYREFGLAEINVIDPTCGSGHFILGAFDRLVARWKQREPGTDVRVHVQKALSQVTGVDINPFAVAIARFRLMIAALNECGLNDLETAPAFELRLATGDALLGWGRTSTHQGELVYDESNDSKAFAFNSEDFDELADYLSLGRYSVVVGNPPYIAVKDSALRSLYRKRFSACSGRYVLTVPFAQLFFRLAKRGAADGSGAGYVGQITSNSFMKREFGKKLINEYFAGEVELSEVIDASGASIPNHGTPTVILVGRNRIVSLRYSGLIRAILGVRGETSTPSMPENAPVWSAIVRQIDAPGSNSEWINCVDLDRQRLARHPWSLSGGAAPDVMDHLESNSRRNLGEIAQEIGITAVTGEDDLYLLASADAARRLGVTKVVPLVEGDAVRDFRVISTDTALWPYSDNFEVLDISVLGELGKLFETYREAINRRKRFGTPMVERGLTWWEWQELYREKLRSPLSIVYAEVATHNHFVFDRGGKVFNRTAPVVKLGPDAAEVEYLKVLGVLASSAGCFWLKQVSHNKGGPGGGSSKGEKWRDFYQFNSTKLKSFPLPDAFPQRQIEILDSLASRLASVMPENVINQDVPTRAGLEAARNEYESLQRQMVAHQEELDWETYRCYGLTDGDFTTPAPPEITLGQRAFEIVFAREVADGRAQTRWFSDFGGMPTTELPDTWSAEYRAVVQRRLDAISSDTRISLLERPDFKRPWDWPTWGSLEKAALRDWLLGRLEADEIWAGAPMPKSVAQLADHVRHDDVFRSVMDLWVGSDQYDLVKTIGKLITDDHVPYLPSLRYKESGLRKRVQWENTWDLQRRKVRGEDLEIPLPPKYATGDFAKASYWRNRGKLDVPAERFISYPNVGREGDPTLLVGWAGWDKLSQAQALATIYLDRKNVAGWQREGLLPLLAGLTELEPWLKQWFDEERAGFPGGTPAKFFTNFVNAELATLGADRNDLVKIRGLM
ncbi:BREX-2 system adenine-specific DNA-methyltransferase PglX [Actinoplanes bogorensis]|uniref:site-specific DNA-methyltransferase (adenine-specific) n=1 Tax=Paractinoplanes bogorensis TaxID=1610840 RepID=A0ABS5Z1M5_9ACTN|nr:BREX-2 system adenine-specific DNA-methyltransferase PglX [Actinoplanes bogorensis]MBU2668295.1 BREX-2 system adenine-specific DNA-methyltransferase PglX [Actinoplanes bogorensis]